MGKLANKRKKNAAPAAMGRFAEYEWLASLIWLLRPDLRKLFKASDGISMEFARWLVTSGVHEYKSLAVSDGLKSVLSRPLKILGISPLEAMIYLERPDVQKAFPLPAAKNGFHKWFIQHGINEHKVLDLLNGDILKKYYAMYPEKNKVEANKKNTDLPYGVNLHGYAYGQLGIGEDLRMTARALQDAHVPFTIINFPPGADIPQNDRSMEQYVGKEAPYKFNVFCMTALETARYYAERGPKMFDGRYNIGYWPWELSKWPDEWKDLTRLVDEVWVSSRHTYNALAPVSDVPVLIMPLAVEVENISSLDRKDFNLPEDAYIFCFSFDFKSSIHRKNPRACVKAFMRAFPLNENIERPVALLIKCHKPAQPNKDWDELKEIAAKDSRIHIIERTLKREDLLALYKCCDCYLSLHRAEGFGRGIAESLLLGLNVITTGYSGNLEYCAADPRAHIARYKLIPVGAGQYPYGEGKLWAEVDLDSAADLMRACASAQPKNAIRKEDIFALSICAKRFRQRLRVIWNNLHSQHAPAVNMETASE